MVVLSGDVGGTTTRMQFTDFSSTSNTIAVIATKHYHNSDYSNFLDIVTSFFKETNQQHDFVMSACFGVAGPIIKEVVNVTNLPWVIEAQQIKNKLSLDRVELINDFAAIGYGIEVLKPEDLFTLQVGKQQQDGVIAYIGAGTGLGIGFMTCQDGKYSVHSTEGGHVDFAPIDAIQADLLKYLHTMYHRISFERVLSGIGLVNIYRFVRDHKIFGEKENPDLRFLIDSRKKIDIAATVAEYAIKHKDIMAMRALDIFIRIYGAAVGNLALTTLPFGGLYVVGGIAPKLLKQIKRGGFMEAFGDKGRMSNLIKTIPLHIVLNKDIGLQGAAVRARQLVI